MDDIREFALFYKIKLSLISRKSYENSESHFMYLTKATFNLSHVKYIAFDLNIQWSEIIQGNQYIAVTTEMFKLKIFNPVKT